MELKEYQAKYESMLKFLEQPLDKEYDNLITRMEHLGILLARAGEYMTEAAYRIDEVVDIECKVNLELLDKYSASTFNMMIKAKAKDWNKLKLGFERCCSSAVHQIDAIRTIISFEKAKMNLI
jgi:predicted nucleic acid-binding protein